MNQQQTIGVNPGLDHSVWTTSLSRLGGLLTSLVNEFVQCVHAIIPNNPAGTESYEKSVVIEEVIQYDSSTYGPAPVLKDGVASDCRGVIGAGNMQGRVWGRYTQGEVQPNADGFVIGHENCMVNNGTDQPEMDTPTTKIHESFTGLGAFPSTAVQYFHAGRTPAGATVPLAHRLRVIREDAIAPGGAVDEIRKAGSNEPLYRLTAHGQLTLQAVTPRRFFPVFVNQPVPPALEPGELAVWGDTANGIVYLLFHNGAALLKTPLM